MLVCTFVSIPRTCATAIQLGIQGNLPAAPFIPLVIAYFVISFFFVADQNNVMDRMGKYLTPLLALILVIVAFVGIFNPLGTPVAPAVDHPFVNAFLGGYNTGDVLVSFIMAAVFISSIYGKGYTTVGQRNKCSSTAASFPSSCCSSSMAACSTWAPVSVVTMRRISAVRNS